MSFKPVFLLAAALAVACTAKQAPQQRGIPRACPESVGMSSTHLALIDSAVNASIGAGEIHGAVVGVVHQGVLVYEKAFGYKSLVPERDTLSCKTLFDLASLSKCVGTTLSVMQLVERGQLRLMDPVSRYIPGFKPWKDPGDHGLLGLALTQKQLVDAVFQCFFGDAESAGHVALGIQVDGQDFLTGLCQAGREIDGGGRLADTAFLVCDCDDPFHVCS